MHHAAQSEKRGAPLMNILDYLATEFATFEEKPFNPVDSAALSLFCMVRVEGIAPPLRERASFKRSAPSWTTSSRPSNDPYAHRPAARRALRRHVHRPRTKPREGEPARARSQPALRDVTVKDCLSLFDADRQTQFAAMAFVHKKEFAYVGFRAPTPRSPAGAKTSTWRTTRPCPLKSMRCATLRPSRRACRSASS